MKRVIFIIIAALLAALALVSFQEQRGGLSNLLTVEDTNDPELIAFSHPSGVYSQSLTINVVAGCDNPLLAVTIDGSDPNLDSGESVPLPLKLDLDRPALTVVKAKGQCPDQPATDTIAASYVIGVPHTLPIASLMVDPDSLTNPATGLLNHVEERGREWERDSHVTLFDGNTVLDFNAGLRLHGSTSRQSPKKSWRLYFRSEYDLSRLNYPILGDNAFPQSYKRLVLSSGSQDWTLLRTLIVNQLAEDLGLPTTNARPIHLFINGAPNGLYLARNYLSDHFYRGKFGYEVVEQFDPSREDYSILAPDGVDNVDGLSAEIQTIWADNNWEKIRDFLNTHDLSDDANLAIIADQVNLPQLIDYHILQLYIANRDWIRNNNDMFRPLEMANGSAVDSRWQYIVWDVDFALGTSPASWGNVESDMFAWLYSDIDPRFDRGSLLIRSLFQNEQFRAQFMARMDEVLNSTLASSNVNKHIDAAVAELESDISAEMLRWGNRGNWARNVDDLHTFSARRPDLMRAHAAKWLSSIQGQ